MADGSKAVIQFLRGVDEPVVPDIRVTRSRDGRTGQAIFVFEQPEALAPEVMEAITGMFMLDEEGMLVTREVNGKFVNGKASALEVPRAPHPPPGSLRRAGRGSEVFHAVPRVFSSPRESTLPDVFAG